MVTNETDRRASIDGAEPCFDCGSTLWVHDCASERPTGGGTTKRAPAPSRAAMLDVQLDAAIARADAAEQDARGLAEKLGEEIVARQAAERALADGRAKVAQHETTIRALTTRINVAEPKLDAWRSWGRQHGYGLGPEDTLTGPEPEATEGGA